jgi:3-dehydroquinate synthase
MQTLDLQFSIRYAFPVFFTRDVFSTGNPLLASTLLRAGEKCHRVLCAVDSGVLAQRPSLCLEIEAYALAHPESMQLCGPILVVDGGESCKNGSAAVDTMLSAIHKNHLCRHSFIVAVGGGAVLDAVGYCAAVAHRGLRLIRMPTTVLGQNDAGIGVKNGINALGRKNFVGTFAPPFAVINDFDFLDTLPPREFRAGMAEAVKVALIKDKLFFDYLYIRRFELAAFSPRPIEEMIHRCAAQHMHHIGTGGDPFELGSARPLDFGHWSAHKLEQMSAFQFGHGEAVAVGIALDLVYSRRLGLLPDAIAQRILGVVQALGFKLYTPLLDQRGPDGRRAVLQGLDEFREHMGGRLTIPLIRAPGERLDVHTMETAVIEAAIDELKDRHG